MHFDERDLNNAGCVAIVIGLHIEHTVTGSQHSVQGGHDGANRDRGHHVELDQQLCNVFGKGGSVRRMVHAK